MCANYRVLICCTCDFQSCSLFILASSLWWSLQCLVSALTQGGDVGHLFRLTCSAMLWGGRNTTNKYHWCAWGVLAVSGPHWVCSPCPRSRLTACVLSQSTLLRLQVALQLSKAGLGCVPFAGLSHSGSDSQVLHKGADSDGPAFCALPRSEQLR